MIAAILNPADNFTYLVRIFSGKNQLISYLRFRGADIGSPTPPFPPDPAYLITLAADLNENSISAGLLKLEFALFSKK